MIRRIGSTLWLLIPSAAVGICLAGCQRIEPTEAGVIGTWEFKSIDAVTRTVYRRDHRAVDLILENDQPNARWVPAAVGTWRLEDNVIIKETEILPFPGHSAVRDQTQVIRIPIQKFNLGNNASTEDDSNFYRARERAQRLAQGVSILYVFGVLTALLAGIYGLRKTRFRMGFLFFVIAALFAILWASSLFAAELAQTGTVIFSWRLLDYLSLIRVVLGCASVTAFVFGLISFGISSMRSSAITS